MSVEIDLDLWLKLTGADEEVEIGDKPDLQLLKKLVKYQLNKVWYQNLDLLTTRAEVDMTPTALLNRLLVEDKGGACFEGCELMELVLEGFKFNAKRVGMFIANGPVYQEGAVMTHYAVVVLLDDKKYLVDVACSYNSIIEPLEFSFEETEERVVIPEVEQYKLEVCNDHCHLHMWLKDSWAPMYRINLPISYITSHNQLVNEYKRMLNSSQIIMTRDHTLKIGRLTETGKIGFTCPFDSRNLHGSGPYTKVMAQNFEPARSEKISYNDFYIGVKQFFGITLDDKCFEQL